MLTGIKTWTEQPLVINTEMAVKLGLDEAIICQQIAYWCQINRKANRNYQDEHYWTYNTFEDWQRQFPFWSMATIKRAFKRLEKQGYIIGGNYNKLWNDRTKWYRLNPEAFDFKDAPIVPIPEITEKDLWMRHKMVEHEVKKAQRRELVRAGRIPDGSHD